jgi:putative ubiquitin-RnfH superfamily antitoxin RatB of RatAB toxin-antitoxin module
MNGDRNNAQDQDALPRATVRVTVVWAPSGAPPSEVQVELPAGSTIGQAALASGLLGSASLDIAVLDLGVFNRPHAPATVLREGDRVEIYRPLAIDPKEARRIRAQVRRRRKASG